MICWTPCSPNRTCPNILKKTTLNCCGNPMHILIAILVHGAFAIFALAVGLASFSSFSNFVVGATVLLWPVGCYLFAFDLFNIRTRCTPVSYTHLDVYKRQEPTTASSPIDLKYLP